MVLEPAELARIPQSNTLDGHRGCLQFGDAQVLGQPVYQLG
jgi:hypothetical protein